MLRLSEESRQIVYLNLVHISLWSSSIMKTGVFVFILLAFLSETLNIASADLDTDSELKSQCGGYCFSVLTPVLDHFAELKEASKAANEINLKVISLQIQLAIAENQIKNKIELITQKDQQIRDKIVIITQKDQQIKDKNELIAQKDEKVRDKIELIIQKDEQIKEKSYLLTQKDEQIKYKIELITQKDEQIKEKNDLIAQKDEQIKDKMVIITQKDQQAKNNIELIAQRDEQIKEKNELIAQKDEQIKEQNQIILQKDQQIKEKNAQIRDKTELISTKTNETHIQSEQNKNKEVYDFATTKKRLSAAIKKPWCLIADKEGIYKMHVRGLNIFEAPCSKDGWLIIQKRFDGSVNFSRNWEDYKHGFGDVYGEFFIGLEKLHLITEVKTYELRIELGDVNGRTAYGHFHSRARDIRTHSTEVLVFWPRWTFLWNCPYAHYDDFEIGSEKESYSLKSIGNYTGTAGDSLDYHMGMKFTTFDRDNDLYSENCASDDFGGWWFRNCAHSALNGKYFKDGRAEQYKGIKWAHFPNFDYTSSLTSARMMIKPNLI